MKVGFIGLGIMGRPMAKNLLNAGVELIVSDLNTEAVNELVCEDWLKAKLIEAFYNTADFMRNRED